MADHEHYMRIALEEAERGAAEGNVAVGSILVSAEKVVARGRNLVTSTSDPTAHAETVALRNAGEQLGHTDFSKLTLYTTFEPCPMCCGAILASSVHTLVMGVRHDLTQSNWGAYTVEKLLELTNKESQLTVITGILTRECADVRKFETE
tara:strand:- start:85 stop:534 length:450 start_codon:yes stop_codon:yes gene_type:complete